MVDGSAFFLFCHDDVRLEPDALQLMVEAPFVRTPASSPEVRLLRRPMVLLHVGQTCDRFGVVHERIELGEIDHGHRTRARCLRGPGRRHARTFRPLRNPPRLRPIIPVLGEDLDLCWRAQIAVRASWSLHWRRLPTAR